MRVGMGGGTRAGLRVRVLMGMKMVIWTKMEQLGMSRQEKRRAKWKDIGQNERMRDEIEGDRNRTERKYVQCA